MTAIKVFAIRASLEKIRFVRHAGKQFFSAGLLLLSIVVSVRGRTVPDVRDPLGFFTTVADKMLRSTFPFGVTNIPVCSNGVYVYTPAMQRLLQLSANIYDAANTNFFPVVFRPLFFKDASNNIFIIGYQQVTNVSGTGDTQLSPPYDVTQLMNYSGSTPIADAHGPVNIYGAPWIIGAKKGLPGFNQLSLVTAVTVTRKLQVTRTTTDPSTATYATNQMYVMSISNNLGISFWNPYTNTYPRPVTIFACDAICMQLNNSELPIGSANFYLGSPTGFTIPGWPGSQWNSGPPNARLQNTASFVVANWSFNYLNPSVCRFNAASGMAFDPIGSSTGSQWDFNPQLPQLPQLDLMITNYLQAFILDGNNVIDYVHLRGPVGNGNLNQALADPDFPDPIRPNKYYQWSTNAFQPPFAGPSYGVINQLAVSGNPSLAPGGNYWATPVGLPSNLPSTVDFIAAYFNAFFYPAFFYNGQILTNSQLTILAPYISQRTICSPYLLQANDPLVHYLASDLDLQYGATAVWENNSSWRNGLWMHLDDQQLQPLPRPPITPVRGRYQPWLQPGQMNLLPSVIPVTNNYAIKDPLIKFSDNWSFPSNLLSSLAWLGQVHRGTPWQTFYLKDADFTKNYIVSHGGINYVGTNTWMQWTGDFDPNDAALMAPVGDWRLAGLLMSLLNTHDPTQLFSVNNRNAADWQNLMRGLTAVSNSAPFVFYGTPVQFDNYDLASNSPQVVTIAGGIAQFTASQPNQTYFSIGDILAAPVLTRQSPFLNLGSATIGHQQMNYGITDWEYETIPAQLLPLLRPDSLGALTLTNGGWNLWFSGADGYEYAVQISTNLLDWSSVSTNSPVQGGFSVPVIPANGSRSQFFRSVLLP